MNHEAGSLVTARNVTVTFPVRHGLFAGRRFAAVDNVSLDIHRGEVLALVGESGSGKTTLGRALLGLTAPARGEVRFRNIPVRRATDATSRALRREMQIIFQDPYASLDPRMTVGAAVAEGLDIHGIGTRAERTEKVLALLRRVGLDPEHAHRYPHAMSGGQRQRVGIARALALEPSFLVADEPVSSLDVSIQAQIIRLLLELKHERDLTMLFVTHNLGVVRLMADRVAVMYRGRIVECAATDDIFERPAHPYTRLLLDSVPRPDPEHRITGAGPTDTRDLTAGDAGCAFRARCARSMAECARSAPPLTSRSGETRAVACLSPLTDHQAIKEPSKCPTNR
jgi:oligopeptide/dipeptide ABC transporter ATP-binding protein